MNLTVWRAAERARSEWKNGGGTTSEVACAPPGAGLDDFDWRVSVADVHADGAFSTFGGVDRVIVLLDGEAMDLIVDGRNQRLLPHRPFGFAGEAVTVCSLPAGPTRDLNVMTRRNHYAAVVELRPVAAVEPMIFPAGDPLMVVALTGTIEVTASDGEHASLGALDAAASDAPGGLAVAGEGVVVTVRFLAEG